MTLLNFVHWNVASVSHEGAKTLKTLRKVSTA